MMARIMIFYSGEGNVCGDRAEKEYYSRFAQVIDPDSICNQTLTYADSCTVDDINDLYTTEVRIKISTFCQDEYRDTIRITNGIIYPMRFFNYNLSAMDLDNSYIPKQTPLNFNEKEKCIFVFALKTRTSMKMKEKTPKNSEK